MLQEMNNIIDFDEASKAWRKNKSYQGRGYFKYKCQHHNCDELLYSYTTSSKLFDKFATDFDIANREHPNRFKYCEDHLFTEN